jgi:hypothetical protein
MTAQVRLASRPTSPEDYLLNGDHSVYENFSATSFPQFQIKQTGYALDDTLFDLSIYHTPQSSQQHLSGLALNLSYPVAAQFSLPNVKEETQELEDYIQGLNERFELPVEDSIPLTPRTSLDQGQYYGNATLNLADATLRTDTTNLPANFPSTPQPGFLPSPATSSEVTPPRNRVTDIYTHRKTASLHDLSVPHIPNMPPPYNPQFQMYVQNTTYPVMTTPQHVQAQIQTASLADINSSPLQMRRMPTPPFSLPLSPMYPKGRSASPFDSSTTPERHTSPESEYAGPRSTFSSPQRRTQMVFDTPPFSPSLPPHLNLQPRRRRTHARGYSTTSIMTNCTDDAPSPQETSPEEYDSEEPEEEDLPRAEFVLPLAMINEWIELPTPPNRKFGCLWKECGRRFGRKYNAQSHVQGHLQVRPHVCNVCRMNFVRHHDLKRHERIHGGDKPYRCGCSKSFARHDALTRHKQR